MAKETTSFPTMGESIIGHVVNVSGQSSPYTKAVKNKNNKSADPGGADKANRGATTASMGNEMNGPGGKIVAKICYPNDPEQSKVLRNVKKVTGPTPFYGARKAAGNTGNV